MLSGCGDDNEAFAPHRPASKPGEDPLAFPDERE
jgi:hypothetical protein